MQINLLGKNLEITDAINEYVEKRVTNLGKLLSKIENSGGEVMVHFEVGRRTNGQNKGDVFHADCSINIDGKKFYAQADKEDLYEAIDDIKETLFREINKDKDRAQTLFKRGAISVKKMLKGLSKRNPFTGKY